MRITSSMVALASARASSALLTHCASSLVLPTVCTTSPSSPMSWMGEFIGSGIHSSLQYTCLIPSLTTLLSSATALLFPFCQTTMATSPGLYVMHVGSVKP